jgi:hypothetical protein
MIARTDYRAIKDHCHMLEVGAFRYVNDEKPYKYRCLTCGRLLKKLSGFVAKQVEQTLDACYRNPTK